MNLTIKGVSQTLNNLNRVQQGIGSDKPMKGAEEVLVRAARKNTPVDTGALRNSITAKVTAHGNHITGVIGSNLKYAMAVEKGTRPHFPPIHAVEGWARRHGIKAFLVARAISRRGTKGHHMLERALEDNRRKVIQFFEDYNRKLVQDAN
jgi:HK97 gp10 family phage protein